MNWGPVLTDTVQAFIGINAVYFALAAIGLNVQFGYSGLLNFGQAAFMACGAYGLGMTAQAFDVSVWLGFPIGIGYAVGLALLLGAPTLRLRADYLAIVTIAAAEIVRLVVRSVRFKPQFGGSDGINEFSGEFQDVGTDLFKPADEYRLWLIGRIHIRDWQIGPLDIRNFDPFVFSGRQMWTLLIGWILVMLCAVFVYLLMRSPWGRVMKGIREDEDAVRSLGKNVYGYKMSALIIGGVIGTFSGMIFSLDRGSVQADNYSRDVTFYVLTALVLGGMAKVSGSITGPMVFWAIFAFSDSALREWLSTRGGTLTIGNVRLLTSTQVGPTRLMLVGLLLMLLMIYRPQGIFGNRKEMAFE